MAKLSEPVCEELQQTVARLTEELAAYRLMLASSTDSLYMVDRDCRYIFINNRHLLTRLNLPLEAVLGRSYDEFHSPEQTEEFCRLVDEVVTTGIPLQHEHKSQLDGRHFLRTFSPVGKPASPDHINAVLIISKDITTIRLAEEERNKLEAQFLQAQKMEAIGTLAGGIAHDFNNLLMGIQGSISLMLYNLDKNHPHYERLKNVEMQVQGGADLTKQLLGFARGGKYEIKTTDLNKIVRKSAAVFGQTKKEIIIAEKYAPGLWRVEADQGQLEQVMFNLYINAWQAMPEGGTLSLETDNCELDGNYSRQYFVQPGRYVKITVADTGVGMDEHIRARVFEPFFTTKEMGRGTGLGLATVYGIVKAHGGLINVYSELGNGSTFSIYLPASNNETEQEKTKVPELSRGTETILLIDDEKMVIEVTKELLEMLGYQVIMATSGSEALDIYCRQGKEISLVVLDMIMPGMSGGETFDALKRLNPLVKVVLSSGYSLNHKVSDILERGCHAFLQKPFSTHELSRIIRKTLAEG